MIRIQGEGRLGQDPDLRSTASGRPVVGLRVAATNRSPREGEKTTLWIDVEAWGDLAENIAEELHKGDYIQFNGRLQEDEWVKKDEIREDADGNLVKTRKFKITADSVAKPVSRFPADGDSQGMSDRERIREAKHEVETLTLDEEDPF